MDAIIPKYALVIQWDGDYWHGYRKPGDNRPFDGRQYRRMKLDHSQDAYMRKHGYVVMRFWEHEVHDDPKGVRKAIAEALRRFREKEAAAQPDMFVAHHEPEQVELAGL